MEAHEHIWDAQKRTETMWGDRRVSRACSNSFTSDMMTEPLTIQQSLHRLHLSGCPYLQVCQCRDQLPPLRKATMIDYSMHMDVLLSRTHLLTQSSAPASSRGARRLPQDGKTLESLEPCPGSPQTTASPTRQATRPWSYLGFEEGMGHPQSKATDLLLLLARFLERSWEFPYVR